MSKPPIRKPQSRHIQEAIQQAVSFHQQGKLKEAERLYKEVLKIRPRHFDALHMLGALCSQKGDQVAALKLLSLALRERPNAAEARSNLGIALIKLNRYDEALAQFEQALTIKPKYFDAINNRGIALVGLNRHTEAIANFARALEIKPNDAKTHMHEALARLTVGDFSAGWHEYERRWEVENFTSPKRTFKQPLWDGSASLAGKTILVHAEQGFGDTIQFARYVPELAQKGARVLLEVPKPLQALMQGGLSGVENVIARGEGLPNFDLHCPLMSLPLCFGTTLQSIPATVPYLRAPSERVEKWRQRLGAGARPRIGVVWAGGPTPQIVQSRAIALSELKVLEGLNVDFVSLQKEVGDEYKSLLANRGNVIHLGQELRDFTDTSAVLSLLDLVVSVDTSVAHLAGALGKPVWILLPFSSDWRWLLEREDSPWYPTARLFRQPRVGDWKSVMERVRTQLATTFGGLSGDSGTSEQYGSSLSGSRQDKVNLSASTTLDEAVAFLQRGELVQSEERFRTVLQAYPSHFDALHLLGVLSAKQGNPDEAVKLMTLALEQKRDVAEVHSNLGMALSELSRNEEAVASFDKALAINPGHLPTLFGRAAGLAKLRRYEEALVDFEKGLQIKPDDANALKNRGHILSRMKRYEEAIACYGHALTLEPDLDYVFGQMTYNTAHICQWGNLESAKERIVHGVRSGARVISPFPFLALSDDPIDQQKCATAYLNGSLRITPGLMQKRVHYRHDRIRVAYLSADFYDHATAYLTAGLFEAHDRSKFETIGVSFGPDARSDMRQRLKNSFDRFIDVESKNDDQAADLLRSLEIDIAVDLKGYTTDARTGILARCPAPIQVNYLGYAGTIGANFIDYVIADHFVIPEEHSPYYSERVVYLPDCYQVNDSKRRIDERTPSRAEAGLPERGFVFCCFNNNYKLTPQFFDVWMRLLQKVDQSVLWLLRGSEVAERNLRKEALARGVDHNRVVFAPKLPLARHLARHRLADLFLDTLPYNAHTTASDALWAGLPVLTCAGTTFAGRVAGSLLHAVGLPELVTYSFEDYEALALKLATDEALLREIKEKLARNRLTKPLFDTDRFRRHIEAAYMTMWEIHQRGEEPRSFEVPAVN